MVPTKVQPSAIHGLGLFALEAIPKGTLVWQYVEGFDISISVWDQITGIGLREAFPKAALDFLKKYAYKTDKGEYEVCVDDARFMNHSSTPNISARGSMDFAIRDIAAGEEIVCDYKDFIHDFRELQ
jgi:SET domain-containing protein